jgi:hypothetical protein
MKKDIARRFEQMDRSSPALANQHLDTVPDVTSEPS